MADKFISRRVVFIDKDEQKNFIEDVRKILGCTWSELARRLNVHPRTLRDWAREKFHMPEESFLTAMTLSGLDKIAGVRIIDLRKHLKYIAKKGGKVGAELRKGNPSLEDGRKKKWRTWWNSIGRLNRKPVKTAMPVDIPIYSEALAEFVGVMIGDGTVAPYHIAITLNTVADENYIPFVSGLIEKLFRVKPRIYARKSCKATDIVVHRKRLVEFCKEIGLKQGNKIRQGLDIPEWVKENIGFSLACLRGLFDTDGSLFEHRYKVKDTAYSYLKLSFTSRSPALVSSVRTLLICFGLSANITKSGYDVKIENKDDVRRFFELIGTSNPGRLEMFIKWKVAPNGKATVC